jgi:ferric-dicitrate binding protein FerR (iron transport regulator)
LKHFRKTVDSQFLVKVIRDEVNQEEKEFFETWLHESDENKEEYGSLSLIWDKFGNSRIPNPPDAEEQWLKISENINSTPQKDDTQVDTDSIITPLNQVKTQNRSRKFIQRKDYGWVIRFAAMLLIFVAVAYLYNNNRTISAEVKVPIATVKTEPQIFYTAVSGKGEKKTIVLSDGSVIYLNVDSKITYPKIFAEDSRVVELTGEAYFSIKGDKLKPFKVISGNTVTVVTGTEFNILNRNNLVRIVVTKGSVEAYQKYSDKGISLKRGEMTTFRETDGFTQPIKARIDHYLAWRKGKFSFSHTPLSQVMEEISRFYNVPIIFENPELKRKTITGVFDSSSLENIFSIISLALDVKIHHTGSKVIVN